MTTLSTSKIMEISLWFTFDGVNSSSLGFGTWKYETRTIQFKEGFPDILLCVSFSAIDCNSVFKGKETVAKVPR